MKIRSLFPCALALLLSSVVGLHATQTENFGIRVLPVPGKVAIDGKLDDWDLSGGVFGCDNVEEGRDQYAAWFHAMYDKDYVYVLAHFVDPTPYNNPGQPGADYGFQGDCLQFRTITCQGTPQERGNHFTAWRGRDGTDVVEIQKGRNFKEGNIPDAKKSDGVLQAFSVDVDGKGYNQEIAIPWKLLTRDEQPLKAGDTFTLTFEPNFTVGKTGRLTVKEVFKQGVVIDRVFTFQSYTCWGVATLEAKGKVAPRPVRLADTRQFPVTVVGGKPVVDWKGLIKEKVLPGFKPIRFTVPEDGYVSLNINDASGKVVCQLLRGFAYSKGEHEVKWDGLTTPNGDQPGVPVAQGEYKWSAIYHQGIGVRLRGWASNAGIPWDNGSATNWGGDQGNPTYCSTGNGQMYLSWGQAEAGRALVTTDLKGNVRWKNNRAGIAGVKATAEDGGIVYALGGSAGNMAEGGNLYTLDSKSGDYIMGADGTPDINVKSLWPNPEGKSVKAEGIVAKDGLVYLSFTKDNAIMVVDGKTRKLVRMLDVPAPGALAIKGETLYALSAGSKVLGVTAKGEIKALVEGLNGAVALAVDPAGVIYVGEREPDQQVKVFGVDGKLLRNIGCKGGRALLGAWNPDGFYSIGGIAVDTEGKLWVSENDAFPKRVSIWDPVSGKLTKEFFGPTHYGAGGGAINPLDPNIMVGEGCEWQIDPESGLGKCTGIFERSEAAFARFCATNGRLYLATLRAASHGSPITFISIYERLGEGNYKLRAKITSDRKLKTSQFWADENDDALEQAEETKTLPQELTLGGYLYWSINLNTDLTLTAEQEIKVSGFTPCGAPRYDLANMRPFVAPGVASLDGKLLLSAANMTKGNHTTFDCYDTKSGALMWSIPSVFGGVHGSHNAPPPELGLIRGAFGIVGAGTLPEPLGAIWMINSNVSEWHLITRDGFYLSRLFEPDFLKYQWPNEAKPGVSMDKCPPGMGGEDFGGSMIQGKDGKIYIQSGKVALWNLEVVGLDTVRSIGTGKITFSEPDTKLAQAQHEAQMQAAVGAKSVNAKNLIPMFTGNLAKDFAGVETISFKKGDDTAAIATMSWDAQKLYVGFDVKDATPWENGATEPAMMYLSGDTVDLQLGTDPKANAKRNEPALGDLRVSIGSVKGVPKVVIYRKVAKEKHPRTFSSGVVKEYVMESVVEVTDAEVKVNKVNQRYIVEAAIPISALGVTPAKGLVLRGDFGVTFGDPAGQRTRLRSYWSNQHTGLVDDAVFELKIEPNYWGEITFQ